MPLRGIDVSVHNKKIDWTAVKNSGQVDFAILRAGYGNSATQKDSRFEYNYEAATSTGIPVGAYWFSYALSEADAIKEAEACIAVISEKSFTYPIWYDVEYDKQLRLGKIEVSRIIRAFCVRLKAAGYTVGIYMSASPMSTLVESDLLSAYPLWVANVGVSKPSFNGDYDMWQYSWTGRISGIVGDVDLDYSYVDYRTSKSVSATPSAIPSNISVQSVESLSCYVVIPDEGVKEIDFETMKKSGVSAVYIKLGRLFDDSHNRFSQYKYPNLELQAKQAIKANMPFGFIADMCARDANEAVEETDAMKLYIQKYNPPMGVFMALHLTMPKSINDLIMQRYIKYLTQLGLTNKLGIYATRAQLDEITWDDVKERLYLWLIDPVSDLNQLNTLLSPEFFMLGA